MLDAQVIRIFIGYDPVESVAWHTLAHSILELSSKPVALIPVNITNLKNTFARERDEKQSNEFSFTRFLVPYLSGFDGLAVFLDCDQLLRDDIAKIFDPVLEQPGKAVYVVKHSYEPRDDIKYLDNVQFTYPRKNWSSVVVWDCGHSKNSILTPEFVAKASGLELHRFTWLDDEEIGELDVRWNWLVGEYDEPPEDVKNVHWTNGGPYFSEFKDCDFSSEWFAERERMVFCAQRK